MTSPPRSYRVGIACSGRRERALSLVTGVTVEVDVWTSLCGTSIQGGGRESELSDTMCRPNVVRRHHPPRSSYLGGLVRAEGFRCEFRRTSGNPAQTHEAPTHGLVWSTTAGGGSNHERQGEGMPRSREECIRGGGLTATPSDVSAAHDVLTACGSPIEVAFLHAFVAEAEQMGWCVTVRWTSPEGVRRSWCSHPKLEASETQCWVELQAQLGPHRVDFAITACHASRSGGVLRYWEAAPHVVECDGHDYHSSREQRTSDAERDRFLMAKGFRPVRLTGSELHRNPRLCAIDVLHLVRLNPVRFTSGSVPEQATP